MRAELYLDEDVLPDLTPILRGLGYDVVSAHETDALGLSDEEQLQRATAENRAIFTFNYHDFIRLGIEWFASNRSHAGIVISYRQYTHRELRALRQAVTKLLNAVSAEDMRNSIWILDEFRPR